jgi:hypothetical protein
MPNFHCRFTGEGSHVVFQADFDAMDLEAAKHAALDILCAEATERSFRVRGLEIWQGDRRLYPVSDLPAP